MDKLTRAQADLREIDALSSGQSPIHLLHPLAKLTTTIFYIAIVVSFSKYDLTGLITMLLYPVILYQIADISVSTCFSKLRYVLILVMAVGIANPFLDKSYAFRAGNLVITGGMVSMITLMLKGILSLMASFLLIATTKIDAICAALRRIHVPDLLVTLILLTYRYIDVMIDEVSIMTQAYHLRAPRQKGIHISAWGSFLGQLLLRSMDRAEELYNSMQLRGFHGEFYYAKMQAARMSSYLFAAISLLILAALRFVPVTSLIGNMLVR